MPTARLVQIESWSYSRFTDYETCPFKAKLKIIEKRREPSNDTLAFGNRVHAMADSLSSGKVPKLDNEYGFVMTSQPGKGFRIKLEEMAAKGTVPKELETFKEEFAVLRTKKVINECYWAWDSDWQKVEWFSKRAWLRIKVDTHFIDQVKKKKLNETTVYIIDYKTGKQHADHALQRSLYALGAYLTYPDAKMVVAAHWYLDAGVEQAEKFRPEQVDALKEQWLSRTTAMLNDTTFAPNPGNHCNWCHFRKANGGPCKF